jgi:putative copper resistance protein D
VAFSSLTCILNSASGSHPGPELREKLSKIISENGAQARIGSLGAGKEWFKPWRTITGHVSASALGAVAVAIHTLAAAMWCGTLAALVLTVEHRGQWARVLPRFSELSLLCVIALLAGGLTGALVAVDSVSQLFATGYGRVLLIKIVLTLVLIALAWSNRARWLPAAQSHRVTAYVSRSRSLTELAIMTVALTMAAALSVTG